MDDFADMQNVPRKILWLAVYDALPDNITQCMYVVIFSWLLCIISYYYYHM
jgi:hypothetical protein